MSENKLPVSTLCAKIPDIVSYTGSIVAETENSLTLQIKRPRSSKYDTVTFLKSSILMYEIVENNGNPYGWIVTMETVNYWEGNDGMTGVVSFDEDYVIVTNERIGTKVGVNKKLVPEIRLLGEN